MEEFIQTDEKLNIPRWDLLTRQVLAYKQFVYNPIQPYQPYLID
jgi:CRISPR-associated protein Cas1